jgi:hypothetical protein
MRKGKSEGSSLAERRRERGRGKLKADGRQMHITNRKKMGGSTSGPSATCSATTQPGPMNT